MELSKRSNGVKVVVNRGEVVNPLNTKLNSNNKRYYNIERYTDNIKLHVHEDTTDLIFAKSESIVARYYKFFPRKGKCVSLTGPNIVDHYEALRGETFEEFISVENSYPTISCEDNRMVEQSRLLKSTLVFGDISDLIKCIKGKICYLDLDFCTNVQTVSKELDKIFPVIKDKAANVLGLHISACTRGVKSTILDFDKDILFKTIEYLKKECRRSYSILRVDSHRDPRSAPMRTLTIYSYLSMKKKQNAWV